jgi:hypothetical protein
MFLEWKLRTKNIVEITNTWFHCIQSWLRWRKAISIIQKQCVIRNSNTRLSIAIFEKLNWSRTSFLFRRRFLSRCYDSKHFNLQSASQLDFHQMNSQRDFTIINLSATIDFSLITIINLTTILFWKNEIFDRVNIYRW